MKILLFDIRQKKNAKEQSTTISELLYLNLFYWKQPFIPSSKGTIITFMQCKHSESSMNLHGLVWHSIWRFWIQPCLVIHPLSPREQRGCNQGPDKQVGLVEPEQEWKREWKLRKRILLWMGYHDKVPLPWAGQQTWACMHCTLCSSSRVQAGSMRLQNWRGSALQLAYIGNTSHTSQ